MGVAECVGELAADSGELGLEAGFGHTVPASTLEGSTRRWAGFCRMKSIRIGSSPDTFAVVACSGPNRVFDDVSLPVRNTPSMPSHAEKNGNMIPV